MQQSDLGSNCCKDRDTSPSQLRCVDRSNLITMSNAAVGHVYDTIIAEVVNAVRVDFEENGVDEGALEDLKKVRLSLNIHPPFVLATAALASSAALTYHFPSSRQSRSSRFISRSVCRVHFYHALSFRAIVSFGLALIAPAKVATSVGRSLGGCPLAPRGAGERGGEQLARVGDPALLGLFLKASPTAAGAAQSSYPPLPIGLPDPHHVRNPEASQPLSFPLANPRHPNTCQIRRVLTHKS